VVKPPALLVLKIWATTALTAVPLRSKIKRLQTKKSGGNPIFFVLSIRTRWAML
jgi:hypothetical protein